MSTTAEHDEIAQRLVIALDALPVPEEPTGLTALAKPSLASDPRMLLAAALLVLLVATVSSPQFQRAQSACKQYLPGGGKGMQTNAKPGGSGKAQTFGGR